MLINKSINFNFEGIFTLVIESFHNLHDFILDNISFLVGKDEYSFVLMIIITLDLILRLYNQWKQPTGFVAISRLYWHRSLRLCP